MMQTDQIEHTHVEQNEHGQNEEDAEIEVSGLIYLLER